MSGTRGVSNGCGAGARGASEVAGGALGPAGDGLSPADEGGMARGMTGDAPSSARRARTSLRPRRAVSASEHGRLRPALADETREVGIDEDELGADPCEIVVLVVAGWDVRDGPHPIVHRPRAASA